MKSIFIRFNIMVLFALIVVRFGINPLIENYALKVLNKQLDQYTEYIFHGPYFVTMKYLESVPREKIPQTLNNLQKEFGFSIKAVNLNSLELEESDKEKLEKGEMISLDEWTLFYQRIGTSQLAIEMGPIKDFDEIFPIWQFEVMTWITLICFVAILSLMWAFPFWKNLKNIMDAADYFGRGKFNARAYVGIRSPLKPMAETFNNMADKIGDLIKSHKLLVNAVSHELRTPISRLRFGIEMLNVSNDKADIKKCTSDISEDIDDLESLVSELLTYAVFDQKAEFLSFEQIHTLEWINFIISRIEPMAQEKKIELDLIDAPLYINADPKFIGRALENIVLNGIRHAASKITIKVEKKDGNISILVIDDGPGIPKKDLKRVFEPFVRLDESRSRQTGGYGLGLAIVSQIMTRHRGKAYAKKRDGIGATIVLTWPA